MSLKEFLASEDRDGFVKEKVAAMQHHVELCFISMKEGAYLKYQEHFKTVQNNYYAIYGYIMAAYAYGRISFEDSSTLVEEVIELSKVKLG